MLATHALRYSHPMATREVPVFDRARMDDVRAAFMQRVTEPVLPVYHRLDLVPKRPVKTLQTDYDVCLVGAPSKMFAVHNRNSLFAYCPREQITEVKSFIVEMYIRDGVPISCVHFLSDSYLLVAYVQPNDMAVVDIIDISMNRSVRSIEFGMPIVSMLDCDSQVVLLTSTGMVLLIDLSVESFYVWGISYAATHIATNFMATNAAKSLLVMSTAQGVFNLCWKTGRILNKLTNMGDALVAFNSDNVNAMAVTSDCTLTLFELTINPSQVLPTIVATMVGTVTTQSPVQELLFIKNEIVTTHICERWAPAMSTEEWNARPHYINLHHYELPSDVPTENVVRLWTMSRNRLVESGHVYCDSHITSVTVVANTVLVIAETSGTISLWTLWPVKKQAPVKRALLCSSLICHVR
jgi:hypothetical protein